MQARIYLVGNRLYQLLTLAKKADFDEAEMTKYLSSFTLLKDRK